MIEIFWWPQVPLNAYFFVSIDATCIMFPASHSSAMLQYPNMTNLKCHMTFLTSYYILYE